MVDTSTIFGLIALKVKQLPEEVAAGIALSIIQSGTFQMSEHVQALEIAFLFDESAKDFSVKEPYKDAFLSALIDRSGDSLAESSYLRSAIKGVLIGSSKISIQEMLIGVENGSVRWPSVPIALEGYFNNPHVINGMCTAKPIYRRLLIRTLREML